MILRSMLFIPADSERKLAKADDSGADAVILDLEDSVATERKAAARAMAREFLETRPAAGSGRKSRIYVRINPLDSAAAFNDLAAVSPGRPDGIMLPKCSGPDDIALIARQLDELERRDGTPAGAIKIVAIAGESARGVLRLGDYAPAVAKLPRLAGLTWGPWDLATDLGAATNKAADGSLGFTYRLAMSMTLLAAKASGVLAIDTVYADFKDEAGLLALCRTIRREGWNGKLAIHPAQVPIIHAGFRPDAEEIAAAERVVAAFAGASTGVVALDGAMLDRPHLMQAQNILALARAG